MHLHVHVNVSSKITGDYNDIMCWFTSRTCCSTQKPTCMSASGNIVVFWVSAHLQVSAHPPLFDDPTVRVRIHYTQCTCRWLLCISAHPDLWPMNSKCPWVLTRDSMVLHQWQYGKSASSYMYFPWFLSTPAGLTVINPIYRKQLKEAETVYIRQYNAYVVLKLPYKIP